MKKPKRKNTIIKISIIFLLVILFPSGSYSIQKNEKIPTQVIIGGELLQLHVKTSKLIYYSEEDKSKKFKNYDLVQKIQGKAIRKIYNQNAITDIKRQDILQIILEMKENDRVKVTILRDNKEEVLIVSKKEIHHSYFRDEIPFSASLTYINPTDKSFVAVGHGIDFNGLNILDEQGNIYLCDSYEINKSNKNMVGNMHGDKINPSQGNISEITEFGVKGNISGEKILENNSIYEVGNIEDIKIGPAQLIIEEATTNIKKAYDIEITKLNIQEKAQTQSFDFDVQDKELIDNYGGIVQGMSGCPIIQNGKLIGALSHVNCMDTSKGTGVYIKWMMEQ